MRARSSGCSGSRTRRLGVNPDTVYKSGLEPLRKEGAIVSRKSDWDGGWYWQRKSDQEQRES